MWMWLHHSLNCEHLFISSDLSHMVFTFIPKIFHASAAKAQEVSCLHPVNIAGYTVHALYQQPADKTPQISKTEYFARCLFIHLSVCLSICGQILST